MQGKGAGPVNRVELESQVLCAALRQSFHLKDKIGSFTSVRELSHLFPDLLPPPEKDEDEATSNKANYYAVLSMKPQSAANAVISSYLRAVRKFLKNYTVKENRQEYNRILNAGFILRKPRLRLSHDLVVTRRWLHEESRRASIAQQEITVDQTAAVKALQAMIGEGGLAAITGSPNTVPRVAVDPTETPTTPLPAVAPNSPVRPAPPVPPGSVSSPVPAVPPLPPNAPIAHAATAARPSDPVKPASPQVPPAAPAPGQKTAAAQTAAVDAAPPLPPVIAAAMQDGSSQLRFDAKGNEGKGAVPPVPPLPAKFYDPSTYGQSGESSGAPQQVTENIAQVPPKSVHAGTSAAASPEHLVPPVPPLPVQSDQRSAAPASNNAVPPLPPLPIAADQVPSSLPSATAPPSPPAVAVPPVPVLPVQKDLTSVGQQLPSAADVAASVAPPVPPLPQMQPAAAAPTPSVVVPPVPPLPGVAQPVVPPTPPSATAPNLAPPAPPLPSAPPTSAPLPPATAGMPASAPPAPSVSPPAAHPLATAAAAAAANDAASGRLPKESTFVFDESALRKPEPAVKKPVPMVIQLLEAAQIIGPLEVQALAAQMEFAPNVPAERLILNAGYVTQQELASIKLGESLLQQGRITMAQFQVAIYDERTSGLRMAESLQVRGWLSVEVRNAIDDWHRKRS